MIEVCNLTKEFGERTAVSDISFSVKPGEIVGYLGPNGAGKSTTVKMIVGVLQPTGGAVRVCGHDLTHNSNEVKRRVGYVPENAALYSVLTPNEFLSLVTDLHDVPKRDANERIRQLLDVFNLTDVADLQMGTLSKGMRQRVLLISALIHEPDVILLDEPLNGLDVNSALTLRRIIQALARRGKAILYCSHILDVVERLCSRVIVLDHGRIVADDNMERLLASESDGTLESVFRTLTSGKALDDRIGRFVDAMDSPELLD